MKDAQIRLILYFDTVPKHTTLKAIYMHYIFHLFVFCFFSQHLNAQTLQAFSGLPGAASESAVFKPLIFRRNFDASPLAALVPVQ